MRADDPVACVRKQVARFGRIEAPREHSSHSVEHVVHVRVDLEETDADRDLDLDVAALLVVHSGRDHIVDHPRPFAKVQDCRPDEIGWRLDALHSEALISLVGGDGLEDELASSHRRELRGAQLGQLDARGPILCGTALRRGQSRRCGYRCRWSHSRRPWWPWGGRCGRCGRCDRCFRGCCGCLRRRGCRAQQPTKEVCRLSRRDGARLLQPRDEPRRRLLQPCDEPRRVGCERVAGGSRCLRSCNWWSRSRVGNRRADSLLVSSGHSP